MKVRYANHHYIEGDSRRFNTSGVGEVIVYFDDGDCTSECISELEVQVDGDWLPMSDAFRDHAICPDNFNRWFAVPETAEQRDRGWI